MLSRAEAERTNPSRQILVLLLLLFFIIIFFLFLLFLLLGCSTHLPIAHHTSHNAHRTSPSPRPRPGVQRITLTRMQQARIW